MSSDEKGVITDVEQAEPASAPPRGLTKTVTNQLHEFRENEGYVLDDSEGGPEGIKYAADGHTRLIPQPSDDPHDPLNWTKWKKHAVLFVVAAAAFLPDYGSATGAVTLELQAKYVSDSFYHVCVINTGNLSSLYDIYGLLICSEQRLEHDT